jgi:hypothetical protein
MAMLGEPPPADAAGPFQNKFASILTGLLATLILGALFSFVCAVVVLALAAAFGDVGGITGSKSLNSSILPRFLAPALAVTKAGSFNFTLSRYVLLSKSKLRGILMPLAIMTIVGGLSGLVARETFAGGGTSSLWAEVGGAIGFWFASAAICRRDDNKGREYFPFQYYR